MTDYNYQLLKYLVPTTLVSFFISLSVLWLINKSSQKFLPILNVKSAKSPTGAKLLGGLSLTFGLLSLFVALYLKPKIISYQEQMFFVSFFISVSILTIAGYIDDKFEIRARHKIAMQIVALSFLSFQSSYFLSGQNIFLSAFLIMTLGFLLINGNNLIDGLDTLAIKLSIPSSISFFIIGYSVQSYSTMAISMATIAGLCAFYTYNKVPAKIYLGEIGGSLLGLIFVAQSILSFHELQTQYSKVRTIVMILMTISYPVIELGVSFLRRVYFKKSPFKGDKLHLHYILKSKSRLSVPTVTTIMGVGNLAILTSCLYSAYHINPYISFLICNTAYFGIYVSYCGNEWLKVHDKNQIISIFENLSKNDIYLLNSFDLEPLNSQDELKTTIEALSSKSSHIMGRDKSAA